MEEETRSSSIFDDDDDDGTVYTDVAESCPSGEGLGHDHGQYYDAAALAQFCRVTVRLTRDDVVGGPVREFFRSRWP